MSRAGRGASAARDVLGEGLASLRALAREGELEPAGAAFLAHACRALAADEGAILLIMEEGLAASPPGPEGGAGAGRGGGAGAGRGGGAGPGRGAGPGAGRGAGPEGGIGASTAGGAGGAAGLLAGPYHGRAGAGGRLGTRPGDLDLAAAAVAAGAPHASGGDSPVLWCPMVVERRPVGVLAVRRGERLPFLGDELVLLEALATSAAMAVDRLRFCRLWAQKLEQADAAHSQLLRYADDLRTTYASARRRSEELGAALQTVEMAYIATVRALATAVEAKDAYTGGHLARVTAYGLEVCEALGGDLASTPGLEYAFLLHDLGKIGVPDAVLSKAGPLTEEEWALMRQHPAIGLRILEGVPQMEVVRAVVLSHHERWDGTGYPQGLRGAAIPRAARVFAAVDAFDAITTDRPYRAGAGLDEALARLRAASGTQFAPDAVQAIHGVDRARLAEIHATAFAVREQ